MKKTVLLCLFLLALCPTAGAEEARAIFLSLQGFLDKDKLTQPQAVVDQLLQASSPAPLLVLEIDSSSGDLGPVLAFAKSLYELKKLKKVTVLVYLQDNVLGPAALLPFLADEWSASLLVSWGDIPLGTDEALPPNILRNRVRSLIDPHHPHAALLEVLADAMSDPALQVIDDQGWKILAGGKEEKVPFISTTGQTLVVNQNQLLELGLVQAFFPPEELEKKYLFKREAEQPLGEETHSLELSPQVVENKLKRFIHVHPEGPNAVGYLYVGDHGSSISESTWLYIKQGLEFYKKQPPLFIILELNTPGGEVFAAQKISDALKEMDTQFNIPIVAFINDWAISAGAMLAYSCRFIAVAKDGSMGAAEPVYAGEGGKMEAASEKVNSALRTDFANRARFFDRNPLIAEAMVDKDQILVLRHGHVVRLEKESQIRLTGPEPDRVISAKGKLLTLDAARLLEYGVADLVLPPEKLPERTAAEKRTGEWPADKMLLFHAPFFSSIPQAKIQAYRMDWKTQFFVFLATPLVSSLLFMGLMLGAYMEISAPGMSVPGFVAGTCLFLIVLSSFSLEMAGWLELIVLLMGLALILVELFLLPTFGLLGVFGVVLFLGGLFGMLLPSLKTASFEYDTHTFNAAGHYFFKRLAWLCGSLILSLAAIALLGRYVLPGFSAFNRFVLTGHEQNASDGFVAGNNPANLPQPGAQATVFAALRPSGKIAVGEHLYDALSTRDLIEAGEVVVVDRLEGSVIFVRRLLEGEP